MNQSRADRIAESIQKELGSMIQREVKDPRIGFVSVTHVDLSRDLGVAKVFVSCLGTKDQQEESMAGLKSAAAFLRGEVGRRLKLRISPMLDFRADASIEESLHIQQMMKDLPGTHET
ncbi:MAG: 30S ribosome-binding factor RbfA [Firmicutes bacterium]|nr:30S ribosome-binding factor RbfA [Bacillota bacterium]